MRYIEALEKLAHTYTEKHNIPMSELDILLNGNMEKYGLSTRAAYNDCRMMLGNQFNVEELFSLHDLAEMFECSPNEILQVLQERKERFVFDDKEKTIKRTVCDIPTELD